MIKLLYSLVMNWASSDCRHFPCWWMIYHLFSNTYIFSSFVSLYFEWSSILTDCTLEKIWPGLGSIVVTALTKNYNKSAKPIHANMCDKVPTNEFVVSWASHRINSMANSAAPPIIPLAPKWPMIITSPQFGWFIFISLTAVSKLSSSRWKIGPCGKYPVVAFYHTKLILTHCILLQFETKNSPYEDNLP